MVGEDLSSFPELRDLLVATQRLPGAQASILQLLHAVVRVRGARPEVRLHEEDLAGVGSPVQLIWEGRDPFASVADGRRVAELIPDARLHVVEGGGHAPRLAFSDQCARVIQPFLSELEGSP